MVTKTKRIEQRFWQLKKQEILNSLKIITGLIGLLFGVILLVLGISFFGSLITDLHCINPDSLCADYPTRTIGDFIIGFVIIVPIYHIVWVLKNWLDSNWKQATREIKHEIKNEAKKK